MGGGEKITKGFVYLGVDLGDGFGQVEVQLSQVLPQVDLSVEFELRLISVGWTLESERWLLLISYYIYF